MIKTSRDIVDAANERAAFLCREYWNGKRLDVITYLIARGFAKERAPKVADLFIANEIFLASEIGCHIRALRGNHEDL